ncbi:hypothetical protein K3495_g14242 [Podosphaera aphanis]|nr:hypothetical protein K3495_g14242 [Podosphaera aphanis]
MAANDEFPNLVDLSKVGEYDGKKPASRWLAKLEYERLRVRVPDTPLEFFRAVEILFESDAAAWLDSNPRLELFIERKDEATSANMQQFKQALCDRFKNNAASIQKRGGNTQQEISKLSQEEGETLALYHERAQDLLWRGHGRDAPALGEPALTPLEAEVLSNLIYIFVSGIRDPELRKSVVKSGTRVGSLRGTFEIAEDLRLSLERNSDMEREIEERKVSRFLLTRNLSQFKDVKAMSICSI